MTGFGEHVWVVQGCWGMWHTASTLCGPCEELVALAATARGTWGSPPQRKFHEVRAWPLLFLTASATPSRVSAWSRYLQVFVEQKNKWHNTQVLLWFQLLPMATPLSNYKCFLLRDGRWPAIYTVKKLPWDKIRPLMTVTSRADMEWKLLLCGSPVGSFLRKKWVRLHSKWVAGMTYPNLKFSVAPTTCRTWC